ncbi:hypothetical protein M422DRAFT_780073 [Sphaerobolus stellatus SS14]|uniref:ZZ-type domain-containing protein n=1 Tax=Sphaerobolus stellatus (strain SS14) TaxID=990650 RepID=A0A0C9UG98_SPHS4|nr:hypothetical protein M422DRAFT_780073 [Sphaerobolus stellatus SS14]
MASAASVSVTAKPDANVNVSVENDDIAILMYYLDCVTRSLGLDVLPAAITDYGNYQSLSPIDRALVFTRACELSPDEFIDKVIFRDDAREMLTTARNAFWTIEAACDIVSLQRNHFIAGQVQSATQVMFFESSWLKDVYTDPLQRLCRPFLGSRHCVHCHGYSGVCECSNCTRPEDSQCRPAVKITELIGALTITNSTSSASSTGSVHREVVCDVCGWQHIEGVRYKCNVCDNYDLCESCYANNRHMSHTFMGIDRQGARPMQLPGRVPRPLSPPPQASVPLQPVPPPQPTPPFPSRTALAPPLPPRSGSSPQPAPPLPPRSSSGSSPHLSQPPQPAPAPAPAPFPIPPPPQRHRYICDGCGARDLEGILYLCTGCADFGFCQTCYPDKSHDGAHRFKQINYPGAIPILLEARLPAPAPAVLPEVKKPIQDPAGPPPPYPASTSASTSQLETKTSQPETKAKLPFRKDDKVKLTGLSRADMNGKQATVIQEDCGNGRVEVRIDELEKNFKVKLENIVVAADSDDEFLD